MPAPLILVSQKIIRGLQEGKTSIEVARELGCNPSTVSRHARRLGHKFSRVVRPDLDRARIIEQRRSGLKLMAIAIEHKTTDATIWAICKKAGL